MTGTTRWHVMMGVTCSELHVGYDIMACHDENDVIGTTPWERHDGNYMMACHDGNGMMGTT